MEQDRDIRVIYSRPLGFVPGSTHDVRLFRLGKYLETNTRISLCDQPPLLASVATCICVARTKIAKKLIRRWDNERELFYDDIVHVEASAYARWTDFLILVLSIYATYLPIKPSFNVDSPRRPSNPLCCTMDLPISTRNSSGDMGVGNYSLKWGSLPPLVLPK